jgi:hypothetical protein
MLNKISVNHHVISRAAIKELLKAARWSTRGTYGVRRWGTTYSNEIVAGVENYEGSHSKK